MVGTGKRKRTAPRMVREVTVALAPRVVAAGEFKAKCLELMDVVAARHVEYLITKRGKPVAKLVAITEPVLRKPRRGYGSLKGCFEIVGDIVAPAAEYSDFTFDEHNLTG